MTNQSLTDNIAGSREDPRKADELRSSQLLHSLYIINRDLLKVAKPRVRKKLPTNRNEAGYLQLVKGMISYIHDAAHRGWLEYEKRKPEEPRWSLLQAALKVGEFSPDKVRIRREEARMSHYEGCHSVQPDLSKLNEEPLPENIVPCLIAFDKPLEELAKVDPQLLLYYKAYGLNQTNLRSFYLPIKAMESPNLPEYIKRALARYEGLVVLDNIKGGFLHLVENATARGIDPKEIEKAVQLGKKGKSYC